MVLSGCVDGEGDPYDPSQTSGGPRKDAGASDGATTTTSGGTGGSGGSNATGSGGRGGSGATGGSTGGSGGSGGSGGATGGRGGSSGSGGTSGSGGRGGSAGSGGSTGGTGGSGGSGGSGGTSVDAGSCASLPDWMSGGSYATGDKVRGFCSSASPGPTGTGTCVVGKNYVWSCSLDLTCGFLGPGTTGWGLAWSVVGECN